MAELVVRAKRVRDNSTLIEERGQLTTEFRRRELSWRQIEEITGWPQANARRWLRLYERKRAQE